DSGQQVDRAVHYPAASADPRSSLLAQLMRALTLAIWRQVHARVARADVGERLLVPIFAARWRPPEEVAFARRHSFQGVDHLVPARVMGPAHLALPAPAALLEVDQHDEARALSRAELRTTMEHIGLVDKEAARWRLRRDLLVEEFAQRAL